MSEPAARQHLHETHEKVAAEREAGEAPRPRPSPAGGPSMFRVAVEAAAGALPDAPIATVEQVALAVLRVALPLHETQHADAWKAAHERAVHFEWESVKANERAEAAGREAERLHAVETKLRGHLDSIGAAHQEGISARRTLDAMRETEIFELNAQLAEAAALLGHFVDHEDDPCSFDHHGACNQHSGSSLRPCDVAVGRELLARIRGGDDTAEPTSRAICPRCGKSVHVRVDGTLNAHNRPRSLDRCGGSHGAAAEQPMSREN